jgi:hypothetical protein
MNDLYRALTRLVDTLTLLAEAALLEIERRKAEADRKEKPSR